jgi:hypothetical protein
MYLEAEIASSSPRFLGAAGEDAWTAIQKKAQQKNYGTSKQDIDDYAAAGGGAAGTAACIAAGGATGGVSVVASPLCAEGGALIASFVADTIQSIGSALFGGDEFRPQPNDTWNPRADSAVRGIVKALRIKRGLDVDHPPGGSFRNYPEWDGVAVTWARHVNDFVAARGGPIKWFYDSPSDKTPGHIRQAAIDQWVKCGGYWVQDAPQAWNSYTPSGHFELPPASECKNAAGESASKYLPEALVTATQQTMTEVVAGTSSKSSTASTVVKVGAFAGVAAAAWYFRQPLLALASRILRR